MRNIQKGVFAAILCSLFVVLASCTSFIPISSVDSAIANPSVKFTVLGTVSASLNNVFTLGKGPMGVKELLLGIAKETYPSADAVVDITYTGLKGLSSTNYIAEATVIQFQ